MTFLELCNRVREISGVSGDGPPSVTGQRGILQRIVNWVRDAEHEINLLHQNDWQYLRKIGSVNLAVNQGAYAVSDVTTLAINRINRAYINGNALIVMLHQEWLDRLPMFSQGVKGDPQYVVLTPEQQIQVYPIPDKALPLTLDYQLRPIKLTANTDKSLIPERYHDIIVHKALMAYADYEEDMHRYQRANMEYGNWLAMVASEQLPRMEFKRGLFG